jgi:hypothetical protein
MTTTPMPAKLVAKMPSGHNQPDFLPVSLTCYNPVTHSNYTGYSHFDDSAMGLKYLNRSHLLTKEQAPVPTFVPGGYIAVVPCGL